MSHNTTLELRVNDKLAMFKAASITGYELKPLSRWQNRYGGQAYNNVHIVLDPHGREAGIITEQGEIITDSYYMEGKLDSFLREYDAAALENTAIEESGWVSSKIEDENGDLIIEIVIP
jgi:hypothetical protein